MIPSGLLRNLGIGFWKAGKALPQARAWLEKTVAADPLDPRLFLELDQVAELDRVPAPERLARLEKNHAVVARRDDALGREIQLLVLLGRHERAIELLSGHHFRVWEGGGNVHGSFSQAYLMRGREAMKPVGETEFVNGIAAMSASGRYGETRVAAGIVSFADLTLGAAVGDVLDAQKGLKTWDSTGSSCTQLTAI